MRDFFKRQSVIPFETCFAFFCVYSGVVGIFTWGVANDYFRRVLGETLSIAFNVAYLIAGLAVYFGIGLNRRDVEAFGLITVGTSLVVRSIVVYQAAGLDPVILNSYVYAAAFLVACVVRMKSLARYRTLVEARTLDEISYYRPDG